VFGAVIAAGGAFGAETPATLAKTAPALAAFETIRTVLQHPRCQNCHIPGDAPLQFDAGVPHAQNVLRGPDGKGVPGLPCGTCHGAANPPASYGPHLPPGAPNCTAAAGAQVVFIGLSSAELCATIKDRKPEWRPRSPGALRAHVPRQAGALGLGPGGRPEPVAVPHDTLVAAMKTWIAAGAPCPPAAGGSGAK